MSTPKVAVLYYSATGANHQIATWATDAAEAAGADVRRRIFRETAPQSAIDGNEAWKQFRQEVAPNETVAELDDLEWADGILFSVPTRYGNVCSQFAAFVDTTGGLWFQGKLADKVVSAFTSAQNPNGGLETTLESIYKTVIHWGGIIVPPGYTDKSIFAAGGNPAGTSAVVDGQGNIRNAEAIEAAVRHQTKRTVEITRRLLG